MKKILSFVFTAISLFAVASCQIEDLDFVEKGDTQVTFKLGLPDDIATRGEELAVDHLDYAVYNEEGILVSEAVSLENVVFQGDTQSVQLTLVKGMSYTVAFWAQNSQCNAYTVVAGKEGMTVEVDYNGFNNDMTREAFFATESFKVDENLTVEVVLQRPFAKINLGVTTEDWNAAKAAGLNLTMSKVVIGAAPTTLDLLNDKVSGEAVVTYDYAPVPEQDFVVNEKNCKLLSSSFILADKEQSVISEGVEFTLKAENGKELTIEEGLENVPVQRNYATNLVAALTGDLDFSVSTDSDINGDTTIPTGDVDAFKAALADPSTTEIVLPYGVYEGVFLIEKGPKTIKSADPEKQVIIRGKVGVAADVKFENITFDVHDEFSKRTTGNANVDKVDGRERAIVPVYAAKATFEGCNFLNIYDAREVAAIHYGAYKLGSPLEINNCYFEGYAYAIYSRALLTVTNSTFKQNHNTANPRAIFLYGLGDGNGNAPQGNVVFMNNTAAGKASYTMEMSSSTYKGDYTNIHYNVQGNTNFSVDNQAFLPRIEEGWDFTGTTFAEGSETFEFGIPAGDVEAFNAALADPSVTEIVLPYGLYEGLFIHKYGPKTIKSADPARQAVIKGKVAVLAEVAFEDITFDVHNSYSVDPTGISADFDDMERRRDAIVPVYLAKASFKGCSFYNLYDERNVVAIHYGDHKVGATLEVDDCYFEGYAYAIYSRALVTVTNSTFKQTHSEVNPRAIFLYGLGDGNQGNVVFKNNTAAGKTSYTMQMMSSNYNYKKIHYDVQGNTNFSVDGKAFLPDVEKCDFTGTTFAEGSETFDFPVDADDVLDLSNYPAGDVAAFKAALADPSVTEIVLPYGLYEGLFFHTKGAKTIKSADPAKPAVIKGKVAVSNANLAFENVLFDVHDKYSVEATGDSQIDKIEGRRKAIVTIYAAEVTFDGCKFYNLYDNRNVVAIHYGAHVTGATLGVNNCYFQGYAYAIYTRALVSVTNSTFNQTHPEAYPRAIFLYGLGDGKQGNVVFKNNTAKGKTSYTMQMSSTNYDYKKIHYDVQGNKNFSVEGDAFLARTDGTCDFTGTTFAQGSATFEF